MSGASRSETQQQLFKRCHFISPNISQSWPSAHSHPSCEAPLGCLDENMIIIAFILISFFMLQGSASHSTPQPTLYVHVCLRLELSIQLKREGEKSLADLSGPPYQFKANLPISPCCCCELSGLLMKLVELTRLKTSRKTEDQTKQNLDPGFCVFPTEKQGCIHFSLPHPWNFD